MIYLGNFVKILIYMENYTIILFYKYVLINDPIKLMNELKFLQHKFNLLGRTIIAKEGINSTFEGRDEDVNEFLKIFLTDSRFADTHIKKSRGDGTAFKKCSVKVRSEIVTLGLGSVCDIDPNVLTGTKLAPEALHKWFDSNKQFYIIDMRNNYEHLSGYFENSILPTIDNFRDLQAFIDNIQHLKNKTVVTVCTAE